MRFFNLRKKKSQRGAEMVEFAIVLPCFLVILMAIFYGAMWLHDVNALNEVTRAAVRYGVVEQGESEDVGKEKKINDYLASGMNNQSVVNEALFIYESDSNDVKVDAMVNDEPAVEVTLRAKKINKLPPLIDSLIPDNISSTLKMRIENPE